MSFSFDILTILILTSGLLCRKNEFDEGSDRR